jgi:hypothetical protein
MNKKEKALRNVSYAIWLQVFIGTGIIILASIKTEMPDFMRDPIMAGGMLIALAVNSHACVSIYRRTLKENG